MRFTRLLEGPGLQLPWQTDPKRDAFDNLSLQARNDITDEAQVNEIERSEAKNEESLLFSWTDRSASDGIRSIESMA
jgi:hypothetical protein